MRVHTLILTLIYLWSKPSGFVNPFHSLNVAVVASCISIRPAAATSLWFSWMQVHIGWQWWWWLEWSGLQDKSANRIQDKRRSEWRGPHVMIRPSRHPQSGCESKITCDGFPTFGLYACIQSFASIFICGEIGKKGGFLQATPPKKIDEKTEKNYTPKAVSPPAMSPEPG
jgi:hypothetical protein